MAFGSPESAGIPRLAHIVFTVKGNPQQNSHKKSEFHPSSRSRTTAAFVPRCLHSPYIFYGNSTEPDPQLYHVILSCKSAIGASLSEPHTSESNGGFFIYIISERQTGSGKLRGERLKISTADKDQPARKVSS